MQRSLKDAVLAAIRKMLPKRLRGGVLLSKPFFAACYSFYIHSHPVYYLKSLFPFSEKGRVYREWRQSNGGVFPYVWTKEYSSAAYSVQAEVDAGNGLPYVLHKGKKLYFRRGAGGGAIRLGRGCVRLPRPFA